MGIRMWVLVALLAITLLGVGGVSDAYAQEFQECPMPQTELGLPPEIEQYHESLEGFQGCPVPQPEEGSPSQAEERYDDLQVPIYCLMPQTHQYLEPGFDHKELRRHMTQCPEYPIDIIVDPPPPLLDCAEMERKIDEGAADKEERQQYERDCLIVEPPLPECEEPASNIVEGVAAYEELDEFSLHCSDYLGDLLPEHPGHFPPARQEVCKAIVSNYGEGVIRELQQLLVLCPT